MSAVLFTGITYLSAPIGQMVQSAPDIADDLRERFAFLRQPFLVLSNAGRELQNVLSGGTSTPATGTAGQVVVTQSPTSPILSWIAGTVAGIGTTLGATLILVYFLLSSAESLRVKVVHMAPRLSDKKRALRVLRDIENDVSRYLFTITIINAAFGLSVGVAVWALGLPNAILWGVAAGLLNYIPYVGGLVGTLAMIAVSIISFPTLEAAALPPVAYLVLQFIESNFVTPIILGRRLEIHIVAIVVFLTLTTWMWGIVGTIIAVPLLVVIKVFADNFPGMSAYSALLAAEHPPIEESAVEAHAHPPPAEQPDGNKPEAGRV